MYADTHATTSFDINLNTGEYQLVGEGGALPIGTESTPNVTIAGAGPGQTVIEGAAFVGPLGDDIFSIAPGAHLTLQQLTVDGGNGGSRDGSGAGDIFNQGTLLTSNTTVAGGSTTGEGIGGGGILNFGGADLSLGSGSTVDGNVASSSHGGGLANAGTATLTDATISDNQAAGGGGGIYNEGALTVTGGHLNSNSSPAGGQGGGILNTPFGGLSLSGTTLAGNSVLNDGQGGAVYNASSIHWTRPSPLPPVTGALLSQVTITGSSANRHVDTEGTGEGGAIYNAGEATMRITDSNLVGNGADSNGGAIFNSGSLNVDHTTLALNSVIDQWAGGIYDTASGQLTLSNSTLSGNSVVGNGSQFEGTALYKDQNATATLSFDTFAGNPGAHNAATIYSGESPSLVLSSDILAYGTGTQCIVHLSVMVDGGGNIASDDSCTALAGTETNKDPILLPLQFVGETTLPVMPLIATSPAINTTTGQSCTAGEATFTDDEIGQSRPSTVNGTSGCDAGAFQLAAQEQPPPPPAAGPVASPTPPTVTAVSPAFGPPAGGNTVAITGTGFSTASGGTVFDFGSNTATNVSCSSSTSCNVTAPAGALGSVDVTATVGGLTSATNPGDVYTYEVSQQQIVCSTNQDTRFVCQAYLDMQGRTVDPQGVLTWANGLIAGTLTRPQVVLGIDQSVEYRLGLIQSWFRSYLNRSADTGALTTFLTVLESGATQEQVQSFILGSPEYFAAAGGTNSGFLSKLYEQVLNRPIDPTGSASWLAALSHLSRQQVALALLSSPEYQTQLVSSWYERFLHRAVDPGSLAAWVNAMGHGMSDEVVLSGIVGSDEYFSHV